MERLKLQNFSCAGVAYGSLVIPGSTTGDNAFFHEVAASDVDSFIAGLKRQAPAVKIEREGQPQQQSAEAVQVEPDTPADPPETVFSDLPADLNKREFKALLEIEGKDGVFTASFSGVVLGSGSTQKEAVNAAFGSYQGGR